MVVTNKKEIRDTDKICFLVSEVFSVSEWFSSLIKATHEKRVKNQNKVCSNNSNLSPKIWSPIEKIVKVISVKTIPIKNQALEVSIFFFKKYNNAPVKKTKAKTSNPAAIINAKLAIQGDSRPAEAKNF